MILRREALSPTHRRRRGADPIAWVLGLLLIATIASSARENRALRQRAEAAEEELEAVQSLREIERLQREFDGLTAQIGEANLEAERQAAAKRLRDAARVLDELRMGDFPTPVRPDPWGHAEPDR